MAPKTVPPHWIKESHFFGRDRYRCSECKRLSDRPAPVCPFCGTKPGKVKDPMTWVDEAEMISEILEDD